MKKNILSIVFLTIVFTALIVTASVLSQIGATSAYANASGSPGGKTNSPGDGISCTQCHASVINSGNGVATISAQGLINGYTPGQTYTITASITGTTSSKIGFEATVEKDANNSKTGTLIITDGTRTKTTNGGNAVTHKSAGTSATGGTNSWSFDWTAPIAGTGNVTIYAAFNASNSNFSTSGDDIYSTSLNILETSATSINYKDENKTATIYPNPVINSLNIVSSNLINRIDIYNFDGKMIKSITSHSNTSLIDLSDQNSGIYLVKIHTDRNSTVKKFIKR